MEAVQEIVSQVLESESNSNGVIDLLELLKSRDEEIVIAAMNGLCHIFEHYLSIHSEWFTGSPTDMMNSDVMMTYTLWIKSKYQMTINEFLKLLCQPSYQVAALDACMKIVQCFGRTTSIYTFNNDLFIRILSSIITTNDNVSQVIEHFNGKYCMKYQDIKYYTLQDIASIVRTKLDEAYKHNETVSLQLISNTYSLLKEITMATVSPSNWSGDPTVSSGQQAINICSHEKCCQVFSNCWLAFLQLPLSSTIHKKVLLSLHYMVIPHMTKPHLLVDYLVGSYDQGGVFSILALNGLFILMHHYHLDYPNFYHKLYSLLQPSIFHVEYMSRFFKLLNVFLSSSHIPLYLVAAFAKRIARLSLYAPPQGVMIASVLVVNLTRRHPNCKVLLHRSVSANVFELNSDPFMMEEVDPVHCKALESCLWELKTLQNHYHPAVCDVINHLLNPEKQSREEPLHRYLQLAPDELFNKECEPTSEDLQLNFNSPNNFWNI